MFSGSEVSCCALQIEEALGLRMHFTAVPSHAKEAGV